MAVKYGQSADGRRRRVWLLLSGGIDSAACLVFYLKQAFCIECIHISFGQPALLHECAAARRIAHHFSVPLKVLQWTGSAHLQEGEIAGRNAFLLMGALTEIGGNSGLLATGIHAGTSYYDCSPDFLSAMQTVVDGYCDGRVNLTAPFVKWSKQDIFAFCKSEGVPIELTYSCERGTQQPCRECLSCRDRRSLDAL